MNLKQRVTNSTDLHLTASARPVLVIAVLVSSFALSACTNFVRTSKRVSPPVVSVQTGLEGGGEVGTIRSASFDIGRPKLGSTIQGTTGTSTTFRVSAGVHIAR